MNFNQLKDKWFVQKDCAIKIKFCERMWNFFFSFSEWPSQIQALPHKIVIAMLEIHQSFSAEVVCHGRIRRRKNLHSNIRD